MAEMSTGKIIVQLAEDRNVPKQWRVEWVGEDGECYVATFSGPSADRRATNYAEHAQSRIDESYAIDEVG